jgi:holliday junction DNA helicase RuvA
MIARLRGRLLEKEPSALVVEAGGVGYAVAVPVSTFAKITGDSVDLFIHTEVREDAILLFGFLTREERGLFRKLMAVQGVGPMTALAVLSGMSPEELVTAITSGDTRRLQGVPRVGKKTAERICLELREKLDDLAFPLSPSLPGAPETLPHELSDAALALENLGYKPQAARQALLLVRQQSPDAPLESLLRLALKALSS